MLLLKLTTVTCVAHDIVAVAGKGSGRIIVSIRVPSAGQSAIEILGYHVLTVAGNFREGDIAQDILRTTFRVSEALEMRRRCLAVQQCSLSV